MKTLWFLPLFLTLSSVFSQGLPPPSRQVFKCEQNGKVVYSDEPCVGAQRIDIQPTRGLNKTTGRELVGTDVRRERFNEQIAEAYRPIFGENAEQREKRHRRARLEPQTRQSCNKLDEDIPILEASERQANPKDRPKIQEKLFNHRKQFRDLRC